MSNLLPVDPDIYEQFSVHNPGSIQPHGVLLAIELKTLKISHMSENTEEFLGIKPEELIGKSLTDLISAKQVTKIVDIVNQNNPEFVEVLTIKTRKKKVKFKGIVHRLKDQLILELETHLPPNKNQSFHLYNLLKNAITSLSNAGNLSELAQIIAVEIQKITQFDRVMVYRFEIDSSGVVIAEKKRENLESYLDLHYPSSDIPHPARTFYCKNWLRLIPDVNYQPVGIISLPDPLKNEELDLSYAVLRSVFPCHVQYLKNMGVSASMSISLINEKKLWGLVACHHYSPKYVDYETRKVCEFLGRFMSIELLYKQEQEFKKYRTKIQEIQGRIRQVLSNYPLFIGDAMRENESNLLNLVQAKGAVICLGEQLTLIGQTPSKEQIRDLIHDFLNEHKLEIFYTDCLQKNYAKAGEFKDVATGVLAISIFLTSTYHLIWFRPEQLYDVKWAGNPQDFTLISENKIPQLTPRYSFATWKQVVKDKSFPWQILEIEAAQELRNILLLAALKFSQLSQEILEEKAQQANAANVAKSQFLAKMSHELRTPLNAILGFTQMMNRDHSLSSEQQEYLGIINRSGEHLLSLINDVLEMSRIEAGQLILHQSCFDLYVMIESIRELLTLKALSKSLELTVYQDPELPQYVEGDEGKLRQIIVNLVGNAIKFTETGTILLRLSVLKTFINSDKIILKIEAEDTGIGIAAEDLEMIFEPFKQTENQRQSKEGTGLGLSISRQFARLMGGDITVKSQLGQGSTFTCQIQMKIPPKKMRRFVKKKSQQIKGLEQSQPEYRVLVVEDIRDSQLLMVRMLESVGFQVRSANNGQEAINLWQEWQPHLIWMDMRMPILDGYEASRKIRTLEIENPTEKIPVIIIALTATAFDEDRKAILAVGCNDFVSKPFREEVIFEMMEKYLGVKYLYEEMSHNSYSDSPVKFLNFPVLKTQISLMSKSWIQELKQAALSARESRISQLISQIPDQDSLLVKSLHKMINNLAFEQILELTEGIINEENC